MIAGWARGSGDLIRMWPREAGRRLQTLAVKAGNPWEPFAIEKGYSPDDDVVAVFWKEPAHHLEVMWPTTAQELLAVFCDSMCTVGCRSAYGDGRVLRGFCPDQAQLCAKAGFSKQDVKCFVFENARKPLRVYGPHAASHFKLEWQKYYTHSPDAMVPMVSAPDQIEIIVIGGAGPNSLYFPHGQPPLIRKIARHWQPRRTQPVLPSANIRAVPICYFLRM